MRRRLRPGGLHAVRSRSFYSDCMKAIVSRRGQVTIPKAIRDRLGLQQGTVLDWRAEAGKLIGTKIVKSDVFEKWRGSGQLPRGVSVNDYLRRDRGRSRD